MIKLLFSTPSLNVYFLRPYQEQTIFSAVEHKTIFSLFILAKINSEKIVLCIGGIPIQLEGDTLNLAYRLLIELEYLPESPAL